MRQELLQVRPAGLVPGKVDVGRVVVIGGEVWGEGIDDGFRPEVRAPDAEAEQRIGFVVKMLGVGLNLANERFVGGFGEGAPSQKVVARPVAVLHGGVGVDDDLGQVRAAVVVQKGTRVGVV